VNGHLTGTVKQTAVGAITTLPYRGHQIPTGIVKLPVSGSVHVRRLGLEGDHQADLRVHGGPDKAVYIYPAEHYPTWREELGRPEIPWGMFGENLTVEGLLEDDVRIGDRLAVGSVLLEVTQPRQPCFKLGTRFGDMKMIRRFRDSGRSGFYCRVIQEGVLQSGDIIERVATDPEAPTIRSIALEE
jgi:MOSC domain-containing protein YiiM